LLLKSGRCSGFLSRFQQSHFFFVPIFVPTRACGCSQLPASEFGKRAFNGVSLWMYVPLGDRNGRVPRDPRQRKSVTPGVAQPSYCGVAQTIWLERFQLKWLLVLDRLRIDPS
jgi:hypothetical protein